MSYSPIVLFVYKRLFHTRLTIDSLLKCQESKDSILYIFSDAPKCLEDEEEVLNVRDYLKSISGFKNVYIIHRDINFGLAKNIIFGLNELFLTNDRLIILEDDIVVSKYFLNFMNDALSLYQNEKKIWHISGWNYPIDCTNYQYNSYFLQMSNCWGWGTWADRWKHFEKKPDHIINSWTRQMKKRFTLHDANYNFWQQIKYNKKNKINTWAIFWYATIFQKNGLCLNPVKTFTENIGNDGTGENCGNVDIFKSYLNVNYEKNFPKSIQFDSNYYQLIRKFYIQNKTPFFIKVINRLKLLINNIK